MHASILGVTRILGILLLWTALGLVCMVWVKMLSLAGGLESDFVTETASFLILLLLLLSETGPESVTNCGANALSDAGLHGVDLEPEIGHLGLHRGQFILDLRADFCLRHLHEFFLHFFLRILKLRKSEGVYTPTVLPQRNLHAVCDDRSMFRP